MDARRERIYGDLSSDIMSLSVVAIASIVLVSAIDYYKSQLARAADCQEILGTLASIQMSLEQRQTACESEFVKWCVGKNEDYNTCRVLTSEEQSRVDDLSEDE